MSSSGLQGFMQAEHSIHNKLKFQVIWKALKNPVAPMSCPLCLSVCLHLWVITVWTHKLHPPKIHSDTQLPSSLTRSQGYTYHDFTTNPSGEGLKFIVQNPKLC